MPGAMRYHASKDKASPPSRTQWPKGQSLPRAAKTYTQVAKAQLHFAFRASDMPTLAQQALGWGVHTLGLGRDWVLPMVLCQKEKEPRQTTVAGGTNLSPASHPSLRQQQSEFHGML